MRPETKYAKSGSVNLAYQVIGDGAIDLILVVAETPFNIVLEATGLIMKFAQIIEFTTTRIDEFNSNLDFRNLDVLREEDL